MTVSRLIDLFSSFGFVPIEVAEVADQIVDWGYYDKITISPFDGPVGSLRGNILVYENVVPYNTRTYCVVRYNQNSPIEWQRIVCVKDLIHSLDVEVLKTDSRARAETLLNDLSMTGDISEGMGISALLEEAATYQALGVLCPDLALERFRKNGASEAEIASKLEIPEIFVNNVMHPEWLKLRDRLGKISS